MATIDIRIENKPITAIKFSNNLCECISDYGKGRIAFQDAFEDKVIIYCEDIDNLIKALQKAKELWK